MRVTPIAHTVMHTIPEGLEETNFAKRLDVDWNSDIDLLHEFAGRGCYQAWSMPNPATADNEGYLSNIISQGHFSVEEHGNVTFYIEHVSRALMLELERHRHASMSVESQRYVDPRRYHPNVVVPPAYREGALADLGEDLQKHYEECLEKYDRAYHRGRDAGLSIKESREAARAYLPESTPVNFTYTANIRCYRDILYKRWHVAADAEIRELAGKILAELRILAPNSVQDIPEAPFQ